MKEFTAVQILNVTSGILCSRMDDIYDIVHFMWQDDSIHTMQLPASCVPMSKKLLELFPAFEEFNEEIKQLSERARKGEVDFLTEFSPILENFISQNGNSFLVYPLSASEKAGVFLDELQEKFMRDGGRVLEIDPSDPVALERLQLEIEFDED